MKKVYMRGIATYGWDENGCASWLFFDIGQNYRPIACRVGFENEDALLHEMSMQGAPLWPTYDLTSGIFKVLLPQCTRCINISDLRKYGDTNLDGNLILHLPDYLVVESHQKPQRPKKITQN